MVGNAKRNRIAADIGGIKGAIVDVRDNVLLGLSCREGQALDALFGNNLVKVILHFFLRDDVAERVGNVRVARHRPLLLDVIEYLAALRLDRPDTRPSGNKADTAQRSPQRSERPAPEEAAPLHIERLPEPCDPHWQGWKGSRYSTAERKYSWFD